LRDKYRDPVLFTRTIASFVKKTQLISLANQSIYSIFAIEYFVPFGRKCKIEAYGNTTTYLFKPAD
jgi:hypothetical protein